jgi:spermidine/putrescine transport system permease protein
MIPSLPRPAIQRFGLGTFVAGFFVFLFVPLLVVAVFAFNNADYPTPPWMGFTLDWFTANSDERTGLLFDVELIRAIGVSAWVALWVTLLSVGVGTCNAFLLERFEFPGKNAIALLAMLPLVIPGVILGISILAFASRIANFADETWGLDLDFFRPGLPLVILGQFCYIVTIATLTISASLRRFDRTLEEAALNLGASRLAVLWTITLPFLRPSMIGAAALAFLMSFENFNTTLMLVGSDSPLTVLMYSRMREGATPVLNAISLFLMVASALLALLLLWRNRSTNQFNTD